MKFLNFGGLLRLALLLAMGISLLTSTAYAGITIDDFGDTGGAEATAAPPQTVTFSLLDSSNGLENMVGDARDMLAHKSSGNAGVRIGSNNGNLLYSMDSQTQGYGLLQWDGNDSDPQTVTSTLNLDLTTAGCDRFRLYVIQTNVPATLIFRVYQNGSNSDYSQYTVTTGFFTTNQIYTFKYTDFTTGGGSGVTDWQHIGAIECQIQGQNPSFPVDVIIDFLELADPTSVELESFQATANQSDILVKWKTAMEIDTLGFHLWRSTSKNGQYLRITQQLIRAQGGASWGAEYSYSDAINDEKTYYYKLEDIEFNGTSTFHGPVAAIPKQYRSTRR